MGKSKLGSQAGSRPPAAVEVSPEGVLAAALHAAGERPEYAFIPLPPGALEPGIAEPNLHTPNAVADAIGTVLGEVSPRTRAVTLVVPDSTVRVFVLDFDAFPAKAAEAVPVLRFRLRKMVPFDAEQASIGYQFLSQSKGECKVLAAVIPGPILSEYEAAMREAGYEPGAVLPSSLAALEAIDVPEAALAANLSALALTTVITNGSDLLLYRTLDLPADPRLRIAEVQRGIAVAAAYYEDKLGAPPRKVHYAGNEDPAEFANWIGDSGVSLVNLAEQRGSGSVAGRAGIAGVTGALAGVR